MLERIKQKKREEPGANLEAIDEMELPKEEKSNMWQSVVTAYSIATPLVIAVPITFAIFWDQLIKGEVCEFFSLTE